MIEEKAAIEVREIMQKQEGFWHSRDKELADGVLEEVRKTYPEAVICKYYLTYWLLLDKAQRELMREILEDEVKKQRKVLEDLRRSIGQLKR